jgi:hypothetical protein
MYVYDVSMCVIVCIQTGTSLVSCQRRPEVCVYVCLYDVSMCVIVCIQTGIGSVSCQRRPEVCGCMCI